MTFPDPLTRRGRFGLGFAAIMLLPAMAGAQEPWTVTLTPPPSPLAIGSCGAVRLKVFDPAVRGIPRNPAGTLVSMADFDMTVTTSDGKSVVGQYADAYNWSVCSCQGAVDGAVATITAKYPGALLTERTRVADVRFETTTTVAVGKAAGTWNPPGCPAPATAVIAVVPISTIGTVPTATAAPVPAPAPPPISPIVGPAGTTLATAQPIDSGAARVSLTGLTVSGTTASAKVSWKPVPGATSYSISRTSPDSYGPKTFGGITATSWTDTGLNGIGFPVAGAYLYVVTAALGGGATVSGRISWTRPDPSCEAPPVNQPMLTVLDPWWDPALLSWEGPYPNGAELGWEERRNGVVAYRMERSLQGTGQWTLAATSCAGAPPIARISQSGILFAGFRDGLGGVVPGSTYLYRVTALAANGEAGTHTLPWTAPAAVVLRWLSATITGDTVKLKVRYEPPATNAPISPYLLRVTAPYGANQLPSGNCAGVAGCTFVMTAVPSGPQQFTIVAEWRRPTGAYGAAGAVLTTASADTTIVVP